MLKQVMFAIFAFALTVGMSFAGDTIVQRVLELPPQVDNPRNSEGSFVSLRNGCILFAYSHYTGGSSDHDAAFIAGRYSGDGGLTWTQSDDTLVVNEGRWNVMSVSLLRLKDGRLALFYLRKNSLSDCRPVVRYSTDEGKTWGNPEDIIPESQVGYYILNNDRAVQLRSGRLILPVSRHDSPAGEWTKSSMYGTIMCYYSDDAGRSWQRSMTQLDGSPGEGEQGDRIMLQEPGIVELKDGRLKMFCRTDAGSQYVSYSGDKGDTWIPFRSSNMISPRSPASIERIPKSNDLLLVWNNHQGIDPELQSKRTPLSMAVSRDEGVTWEKIKTLEDDPHGWYCYTAIHFSGDHVLLSYCARHGLAETHIVRFPLKWVYADPDK